jgi:hypothetical protein
MYRRPKFLEVLIEIRQEMARESDYDVDLFAEHIRQGVPSKNRRRFKISDNDIENPSAEAKRKTVRRS